VVVVSAMSGETNRLIGLAKQIQTEPDARELDVIASTGEQVTIGLLAMALKAIGVDAVSFTGWQVGLKTDDAYTKARIESIDGTKIKEQLAQGKVVVIAGFQGIDDSNSITTLGRGGSDTSGVAIAAALKADECQIFTDVDGVYTTDPRVAPLAKKLDRITFEEMLEMASMGSKVLQIRSVEFAGKYNVRLRVLSSFEDSNVNEFDPNIGTLITVEEDLAADSMHNPFNSFNPSHSSLIINQNMEQPIVSGIAFNRDEAKLTLLNVPDTPGVAYHILGPIAQANIDVDMIIQNQSTDGSTHFSFTVHKNDYVRAKQLLETVIKPDNVCKISIVGIGMRSHAGVASTMFQTLAKEGINIQMISTSEIKTSVLVEDKYMELAVRSLHTAFGLDKN
jgi:aspartate kinase